MKLARKAGIISTSNVVVKYTGNMTDEIVTMSDGLYRLLTLTSSGVLTFSSSVRCDVCVVGGGSSGDENGEGGAGAYMVTASIPSTIGGAVVVGAGGVAYKSYGRRRVGAGGETSFKSVSSGTVEGKNGGTGGGGNEYLNKFGTGDGLSKYPFGDTAYFAHPHCAGGGGGGSPNGYWRGGNGGTNGGNGGNPYSSDKGGTGGDYGGGTGGYWYATSIGWVTSGTAATYYGSGGGGSGGDGDGQGPGAAGYQGIIYIRIPLSVTTTSN